MNVLCLNERTEYVTHGLLAALNRMGDKVTIYPLSKYPWDDQEKVFRQLINKLKPHLVFTPGWSTGIFNIGAYFRVLQKTDLLHVYWATEDPLFFSEVSMVFAPHSDYIFTTAEEMVDRYKQISVPSTTLMFGVNHLFHYPADPLPKYTHDIILVANNYPWFSEDKRFRNHSIRTVLMPLVEKGYDVRVFGVDWTNPQNEMHIPPEYYGGYCPYEETRQAYSSAKIVLGVQSVNTSRTQTSCRSFEIMGSGAFYLTVQTPSHQALFENHKHLVWTSSPAETVELVDFYLRNDDARQKVAQAGMQEVLSRHTYQHRAIQFKEALRPFMGKRSYYRRIKGES